MPQISRPPGLNHQPLFRHSDLRNARIIELRSSDLHFFRRFDLRGQTSTVEISATSPSQLEGDAASHYRSTPCRPQPSYFGRQTPPKVFGRGSFRGVKLVQGRTKPAVTVSKREEHWTENLKNRVYGRLSQGCRGQNMTTVTELTAELK